MTLLALLGIAGFLVLISTLLFLFQHKLIYHPRPYEMAVARDLERITLPIRYTTDAGRQTAFYIPPRAQRALLPGNPLHDPPERLWLLFHGNASLAADWIDVIEGYRDEQAGYLLIDYPGYGLNEGKPTPGSIRESTDQALDALAGALGRPRSELERHLGLLGFSLGSAAALQFAVEAPVERIVLLAPFTNMLSMARSTVGWPLCHILRHRFDNLAALEAIKRKAPRPRVAVIHGNADQIVPFEMGRELATAHPWIKFMEIPQADHNWLMDVAAEQIEAALEAPAGEPVKPVS